MGKESGLCQTEGKAIVTVSRNTVITEDALVASEREKLYGEICG